MSIRMRLYEFLVNRHPGIRVRYHRMHDQAKGVTRPLSHAYLLWLNFCYYVLFRRHLAKDPRTAPEKRRRLPAGESESMRNRRLHPDLSEERLIERLSACEVISFDVFDTLLFRPFDRPSDLFYLTGGALGVTDFRNKRMEAERTARRKRQEAAGDAEVSLAEIWEILAGSLGIPAEEGMAGEIAAEMRLCFANPLLLSVWEELLRRGKRLVVTTDMYLPEQVIRDLLKQNGFTGADAVFVSGTCRRSKAEGSLYDMVRGAYPRQECIHVGDDPHSDGKQAQKHGLQSVLIPQINRAGAPYRTYDLSAIVGSAWRGIVNASLHNGSAVHSSFYEYGFVTGGLPVLGYCCFLHRCCREQGIDRLLFFSRDGEVLKEVYDQLYPGADTRYVYWSRRAAGKLAAGYDRTDYLDRFLYQKVNQGYTLRQVLETMDLWGERERLFAPEMLRLAGLGSWSESERLTDRNADALSRLLTLQWPLVLTHYRPQREAAERYFRPLLSGAEHVAAADIGWAGSGVRALSLLAEREWKHPVRLTGFVAGTGTLHDAQPEVAEPFLLDGRLSPYLFSAHHNRDLWKVHDAGRGYNLYWELLFSSEQPAFIGFYPGNSCVGPEDRYLPDADLTLRFAEREENPEGLREIRRGILDFIRLYTRIFSEDSCLLNISGRDAYAPFLAAAGHDEQYLRTIASAFALHPRV